MMKEHPERFKEALEDMVWQFAYRGLKDGKPALFEGGLSALEGAFEALGWENPHYIEEDDMITCNIEGCHEFSSAGTHWGNGKEYLRLCDEHYKQSISGIPCPKIKQSVIEKEAKRDPITGIMPVRENDQ